MAVRITTLSENSVGMGNLLGEWGLSVLVETDEARVLLDTGRSISAVCNADALGIELGAIDRVVLSHSHSDHTGGLRNLLRRVRKEVTVIAHPDVWGSTYSFATAPEGQFIGIPFQREGLENLGARFSLTREPLAISEEIMTTGEVPMVTEYEEVASTLFVRDGDRWRRDEVLDDLALVIKTELGLVVVLGCAHRGPINTLYHARKITGVGEIHTVIGGSHLISASEERLWRTINAFRELGVQRLGLCHCTGYKSASVLAQEFGDRFFFNVAGTSVTVPEGA